jgi:hypothetical protein
MASTKAQKKCEIWIVDNWLPKKYRQKFCEKRVCMQNRGEFKFDAVSEDGEIIANISTATARTHRGSVASGKKSKIRADCLMLSLVNTKDKLLVLTEPCMYELANKEQKEGRLPLYIEIQLVDLPEKLKVELLQARTVASKENR